MALLILAALAVPAGAASSAPEPARRASEFSRFERPRVFRWSVDAGAALPGGAGDFSASVGSGFHIGAGVLRDARGRWAFGARVERSVFGTKTLGGADRRAEATAVQAAAEAALGSLGRLRARADAGVGVNWFKLDQKTAAKDLTGRSSGLAWSAGLGLDWPVFEPLSVGLSVRYHSFHVDAATFSASRVDAWVDALTLRFRF